MYKKFLQQKIDNCLYSQISAQILQINTVFSINVITNYLYILIIFL